MRGAEGDLAKTSAGDREYIQGGGQSRFGERCHRLLGTPHVKSWASWNHEWKDADLDGGPGKLIRHRRDQNASQG
jgi:hypothetical protein